MRRCCTRVALAQERVHVALASEYVHVALAQECVHVASLSCDSSYHAGLSQSSEAL